MTFTSVGFLAFFAAVLIIYYFVPKKYAWIPLFVSSLLFYISWGVTFLPLLLGTIVLSYFAALKIGAETNAKLKKLYLTLSIIIIAGCLVFFKYYNFLALSVGGVLSKIGLPADDITLRLLMPAGISFYTFTTLSYLIDVYRGTIKPEVHFGYYALYVSYFPHIMSGPIARAGKLIPQFKAERRFDRDGFLDGLGIALVGFFKKMVVADVIAVYVNAVYGDAEASNGLSAILATILYAVQIYCDFSGYTDIAIGCARMMGIELLQNFNLPYSAVSIKDFWARWHISLSTWFRDYIYIPLGGNRRGKLRKHINVMIVFLVSGLWHGADWTFVIWGALHGVYQIIGDITKGARDALYAKLGADVNGKPVRAIRRTVTSLLVSFAWMFFRADSFADIGILIRRMFTSWGVGADYLKQTFTLMDLDLTGALTIALAIFILYFLDHTPARELFIPVRNDKRSEKISGRAKEPLNVPAPALAVAGSGKADFSGKAEANRQSDDVALLKDEQLPQADVAFDRYTVGAMFTAACRYARIIWIIIAAAMVMSAGGTESSFIYVQF